MTDGSSFNKLPRVFRSVFYNLSSKVTRSGIEPFVINNLSGLNGTICNLGCGNKRWAGEKNEICVELFPKEGVDIIADIHVLPFSACYFDACVLTEVLEHLQNPQKAVDEIYRVLKERGRLILTTRFIFPLHDAPKDYYRFTEFGIRELLKDFSSVEVYPQHDWFTTLVVLVMRTITEKDPVAKIISPLFVALSLGLLPLKPIFSLFGFKDITSGYFVLAEK